MATWDFSTAPDMVEKMSTFQAITLVMHTGVEAWPLFLAELEKAAQMSHRQLVFVDDSTPLPGQDTDLLVEIVEYTGMLPRASQTITRFTEDTGITGALMDLDILSDVHWAVSCFDAPQGIAKKIKSIGPNSYGRDQLKVWQTPPENLPPYQPEELPELGPDDPF